MTRFGPDSQGSSPTTALDLEIAREQAEALGTAGKKLQESIDRFRVSFRREARVPGTQELLDEIVSRAWALMVQRELLGFRHENMSWILAHFDLPTEALRQLGRPDKEFRYRYYD